MGLLEDKDEKEEEETPAMVMRLSEKGPSKTYREAMQNPRVLYSSQHSRYRGFSITGIQRALSYSKTRKKSEISRISLG